MQSEEGPGYAEGAGPGGSSGPWDIPASRRSYGDRRSFKVRGAGATGPHNDTTGSVTAATSAPGAGAYYGGGEEAEGVGLAHAGLGAAHAFGTAAVEAARAAGFEGVDVSGGGGGSGGFGAGGVRSMAGPVVGSWPTHGESLGSGFVSGGRHVLYCGADIPMENLQSGHWTHSPRAPGVSPLQAVASSPRGLHGSGGSGGAGHGHGPFGHAPFGHGSFGSGGEGYPRRHRDDEALGGGMAGGARSGSMAGGGGGGGTVVEDDVLEVEADTPGGYHVSATVLHPADSADPEEFLVTATAFPPPV